MSISNETIIKFMDKMNMKVFMVPEYYDEMKVRVTLKVRREKELEYFCIDWFSMDDEGKLHWRDSDIEIGAHDGIFAFLGDDTAVDNYLLEVSMNFAQKYLDDKIKSK